MIQNIFCSLGFALFSIFAFAADEFPFNDYEDYGHFDEADSWDLFAPFSQTYLFQFDDDLSPHPKNNPDFIRPDDREQAASSYGVTEPSSYLQSLDTPHHVQCPPLQNADRYYQAAPPYPGSTSGTLQNNSYTYYQSGPPQNPHLQTAPLPYTTGTTSSSSRQTCTPYSYYQYHQPQNTYPEPAQLPYPTETFATPPLQSIACHDSRYAAQQPPSSHPTPYPPLPGNFASTSTTMDDAYTGHPQNSQGNVYKFPPSPGELPIWNGNFAWSSNVSGLSQQKLPSTYPRQFDARHGEYGEIQKLVHTLETAVAESKKRSQPSTTPFYDQDHEPDQRESDETKTTHRPEKRRRRLKEEGQQLEEHLRETVSNRQTLVAEALESDGEDFAAFSHEFPHTLTPCQEESLRQIDEDFASLRPMNRVIVGSVGFGKTEIAMRAAFKVANSGKQVVIVAPTKILVEQHFETFQERFKNTGFNVVKVPSQYKSKGFLKSVKDGEASIIVGGHGALSEKIQYDDLGLIIIDEEQKFSVQQKERLHRAFKNAHVLWMTATPIPRTLQLIEDKLVSSSVLKTAPVGRLPIISEYINFDEKDLRRTIDRELERDGQVYVVSFTIANIAPIMEFLTRLYPDVAIDFAHGKMLKQNLEEKMIAFKKGDIQILVSTTVVEVGVDIPNANTMIIFDPQKLGIASLSQLRGRVGRSTRQAYCCIVEPQDNSQPTSSNSTGRISAFVEHSDLGDDFTLSQKDKEARGSGALLRDLQKGHNSNWAQSK